MFITHFFAFCIAIYCFSGGLLFCNSHVYADKAVGQPRSLRFNGIRYVAAQNAMPCQLGNQLFAVAAGLAYAWDNGYVPVFPFLNQPGGNRTFNRDHIFFRLDTSLPRQIRNVYNDTLYRYTPIPICNTDVILNGHFESWKYFHHHRKRIVEIFAPSKEVLDYLHAKYKDLLENEKTVAIHVRTFQKQYRHIVGFVGLKYYELAIDHFPSDSIFVIFSDRIGWCKKHFPESFPDKTFVFIEKNDHIQDLFLFSLMKNHIITNSTYSWWGAYLSTNTTQIVCTPEKKWTPEYHAVPEDYFLPEWIKIPYEYSPESYPDDLELYDDKSQSLD